MKILKYFGSAVICLTALLMACSPDANPFIPQATLKLIARTKSVTAGAASGRVSLSMENATTDGVSVTAYTVSFKKVEIGNSETEKYTIWEEDQAFDIVKEVSLDNVKPVKEGDYRYCRITIGKKISVSGSATSGSQTKTGEAFAEVDETHLFSTDDGTLKEAIQVTGDRKLILEFDITNKVLFDFNEGTLHLKLPVVSFKAE